MKSDSTKCFSRYSFGGLKLKTIDGDHVSMAQVENTCNEQETNDDFPTAWPLDMLSALRK